MNKNTTSFTLRNEFITYPQSELALRRIHEVHAASRAHKHGNGIAILGPSGAGKTTVLKEYIKDLDAKRPPEERPYIFVEVPSSPTPKSLGAAVLYALRDPYADRGSAEDKLSRIVRLIAGLKTSLIVLDEAQHLVERSRMPSGAATDWMKNLLNATKITMVIAGLKRTEDLLLENEQLRRRFSATVHHDRFTLRDQENGTAFARLLVSLQSKIPVDGIAFVGRDILLRFYYASYGLIDYLIKVIDRAVYLVQVGEFADLGLQALASAFRDEVWSRAPNERNPFCLEFKFTDLTHRFEPFHDFERIAS